MLIYSIVSINILIWKKVENTYIEKKQNYTISTKKKSYIEKIKIRYIL